MLFLVSKGVFKIKLLKIKATNFRSYQSLELDFTKTRGLVLLQGTMPQASENSNNGSGKSSTYMSILFALYGKLPNGDSGDSVINRIAGKGTSVILTFKQGNDIYRIERYRKHKEYKNKVLLFRNDSDITLPSMKETDQHITEIIGMSENTMLNSLIFGSNNSVSFVNATDKQRKEMLEQLTGIEVYQKALDLVKNDSKSVHESLIELDKDKQGIISRISSNKALENTYEASRIQYESTKTAYENKLKELHEMSLDDPEDLKLIASDLTKQLAQKTQERNQLNMVQYNSTDLEQVKNQMNTIKYNFNNAKDRMKELAQQIKSIQNSPKTYCQLCGSLLDKDHKQNEINALTKQGKEIRKDYDKLLAQAPQIKTRYDELAKQRQEADNYNASIIPKRNLIQSEMDKINQKLTNTRNKQQQIKDVEKNIVWYNAQYNSLQEPVKPKYEDINKLEKQQVELQEEQKDLTKQEQQLDKLTAVFGLQGVKSHVLSAVLPFVNKRIEHYMDILTEGKFNAFISSKSTAKNGNTSDKMTIDILSQDTGSKYSELSTGEQRKVDLSISLSLQDYLLSKIPDTNFEVFDEVFDGLDEASMQSVIQILKERAKGVDTVFVVSHNDNLKDQFENIITIEKIDGISKIKK